MRRLDADREWICTVVQSECIIQSLKRYAFPQSFKQPCRDPSFRPGHQRKVDRRCGTPFCSATDTYDGDRGTLDLGGREVEFHAIGTAHSPGDQIIWLPKEKILFAGDLIEERMFPIVPFLPPTITKSDIDVAKWVEALSYIAEIDPEIVVPGHGSLGQAEIARALLVYFTDVQARVRNLAQGGNIDALVSELKPQIRTTYSTWEHERFIEPAIRYFAQG